ncbi:helix-turn-helix domain-containing protein [Kineococcus sp. TBRC 1896]|uniref:Helix-turn-helix domain-containing protein n=1 Tax=Kineococcus mangrovi TaxID=1660183 RepID=A0ABV4I7I8_9ACTN
MGFTLPSNIQPTQDPESLVGTTTIAQLIGHTEQWVQTQARAGALPAYRLGGHLRFRLSEVAAWIDAQVTR